MSATYRDINNDVRFIVSSLDNEDRVPPTTAHCFALCSKAPMLCVLISAIFFVEICALSNSRPLLSVSNLYFLFKDFSAIPVYGAVVIGFFQVIMFAPQVAMYLSLPIHVRERSLVMRALRKVAMKCLLTMTALVLLANISAIFYPIMLFSTPIIMVLSIFVFNYIIGFEISKYGLAPAIQKISNILEKV